MRSPGIKKKVVQHTGEHGASRKPGAVRVRIESFHPRGFKGLFLLLSSCLTIAWAFCIYRPTWTLTSPSSRVCRRVRSKPVQVNAGGFGLDSMPVHAYDLGREIACRQGPNLSEGTKLESPIDHVYMPLLSSSAILPTRLVSRGPAGAGCDWALLGEPGSRS
jgi:hypothetical protein